MIEYLIYQTKYWVIKLNPDQAYLGRLVIVAKQQIESLSGLSKSEWDDFAKVVKTCEDVLKKTFQARHFNWTCLMNNAFKSEKYENKKAKPHVHWHCRPRYNKKIKIGDYVFEDPEFAHHYNNKRRIEVSEKLLKKIQEKIKGNLK